MSESWVEERRDKFPTGGFSKIACRVDERWIKSQELSDALAVFFRWPLPVLLPFFDGRVRDCKSQRCSQLCHRELHIDPFFTKVLTQGFWRAWVAA